MNDRSETCGAPFTAADLDGLPLGKAFHKYVLDDREVQKLAAAVIDGKEKEHVAALLQPDGRWPISITVDRLMPDRSFDLLSHINKLVGMPADQSVPRYIEPKASDEMRAVCAVIVERANLLFGYLARGEVLAIDMASRELGQTAWLRPNATICIQTHDFFDSTKDPLRRGLMLHLAKRAGTVSVDAKQTWKAKPSKKLTPSEASVLKACNALWPNGDLDHKAMGRDRQINGWLKSRNESNLSPRTIQRALKKIKFC
jgi:hypothetical protein